MHQFVPILLCLVLSLAPPSALVGLAAKTLAVYALDAQLDRYSASGLTFDECQSRMTELELLLGAPATGHRLTRVWTDGRVLTRWYDPEYDTTLVAIAKPGGDQGYVLEVYAVEDQWPE